MKNFKLKIASIIILIALGAGIALAATSVTLPRDGEGAKMQVFTPTSIVTIAAAEDVTVTSYGAVMFGSDLTIYFDALTTDT